MDAKEKAEKLFITMLSYVSRNEAKQCALIAVDELIIQNGEANLLLKLDNDYYVSINSYLFDVKQELEKL